jgi:hypothetical protein
LFLVLRRVIFHPAFVEAAPAREDDASRCVDDFAVFEMRKQDFTGTGKDIGPTQGALDEVCQPSFFDKRIIIEKNEVFTVGLSRTKIIRPAKSIVLIKLEDPHPRKVLLDVSNRVIGRGVIAEDPLISVSGIEKPSQRFEAIFQVLFAIKI